MRHGLFILTLFVAGCSSTEQERCSRVSKYINDSSFKIKITQVTGYGRVSNIDGISMYSERDTSVYNEQDFFARIKKYCSVGDTIVKKANSNKIMLKKKEKDLAFFYNCKDEPYQKDPIVVVRYK